MAAPKKKGIADLLIAAGPMKKGPPPDDGGDAPLDGDGGGSMENAMTNLLQAIKDDDPQAMADAFHTALDASQ